MKRIHAVSVERDLLLVLALRGPVLGFEVDRLEEAHQVGDLARLGLCPGVASLRPGNIAQEILVMHGPQDKLPIVPALLFVLRADKERCAPLCHRRDVLGQADPVEGSGRNHELVVDAAVVVLLDRDRLEVRPAQGSHRRGRAVW